MPPMCLEFNLQSIHVLTIHLYCLYEVLEIAGAIESNKADASFSKFQMKKMKIFARVLGFQKSSSYKNALFQFHNTKCTLAQWQRQEVSRFEAWVTSSNPSHDLSFYKLEKLTYFLIFSYFLFLIFSYYLIYLLIFLSCI